MSIFFQMTEMKQKEKELSTLAKAFIKAVKNGENKTAKNVFKKHFKSSCPDYTIYPQDAFEEAVSWIQNPGRIKKDKHLMINQRKLTKQESKVIEGLRKKLAPKLKAA